MADRRITVPGEPSFISTPSGTWTQVLVHITVTRSGSLDAVRVLVDRDRVVEVTRGETSRKKLREELDAMARGVGMRAGPAPGPYVAWRIHRVVAAHKAAGGVLTPLAERAVASVPAPEGVLPHPALALSPVEDAVPRVMESVGVHSEPELRGWLPPREALDSVRDFVRRASALPAEASLITLTGPAVTADDPGARTRDAFWAGIDAWYTPEERRRLATALRDAALVFEASRRHDRALDAVATADAIEPAGLFAAPAHGVPFLFGMFYKYMLLHREMAMNQKT